MLDYGKLCPCSGMTTLEFLQMIEEFEEESVEGRRRRDCDEREPRDYERDGGF